MADTTTPTPPVGCDVEDVVTVEGPDAHGLFAVVVWTIEGTALVVERFTTLDVATACRTRIATALQSWGWVK